MANPSLQPHFDPAFRQLQPAHGWYLSSSPIITADWENRSGDEWTVPLGAAVGKLHRLGKLPVNVQLGAYYNVVTPDNGPDWQIRFQVQFLLPKM